MKSKILQYIAIGVITFSIVGASAVHAQTPTPTNSNPFSSFVEFLAQKLGLDKTNVQNAVNEYKQQRKINRGQIVKDRINMRLDMLIQQGKITSDQKTAIINEWNSLKKKYNFDNLKTLTPDQRKQQLQSLQSDWQAWAKSQNIDPTIIMPGFGMGMMGRWMRH